MRGISVVMALVFAGCATVHGTSPAPSTAASNEQAESFLMNVAAAPETSVPPVPNEQPSCAVDAHGQRYCTGGPVVVPMVHVGPLIVTSPPHSTRMRPPSVR